MLSHAILFIGAKKRHLVQYHFIQAGQKTPAPTATAATEEALFTSWGSLSWGDCGSWTFAAGWGVSNNLKLKGDFITRSKEKEGHRGFRVGETERIRPVEGGQTWRSATGSERAVLGTVSSSEVSAGLLEIWSDGTIQCPLSLSGEGG